MLVSHTGPENESDSGTSLHGFKTLQSPIRVKVIWEQGKARLPDKQQPEMYIHIDFQHRNSLLVAFRDVHV